MLIEIIIFHLQMQNISFVLATKLLNLCQQKFVCEFIFLHLRQMPAALQILIIKLTCVQFIKTFLGSQSQ